MPKQVTSLWHGTETNTLTQKTTSVSPINTLHFFGLWEKSRVSEQTHADAGKTFPRLLCLTQESNPAFLVMT